MPKKRVGDKTREGRVVKKMTLERRVVEKITWRKRVVEGRGGSRKR